ncbi:MAG: HAMP domain-containing histidine kinase [Sphaerochaetaceae bacterium]|nr:HAMP domain-containing histidine kinase [Sphaerochaetaceae bacterium]
MLRKLCLKFVLINMTIVTIMLCMIFCVLYYSTSNNLERESIQMMESIAINPLQIGPPNMAIDDVRLPYFSVVIDYNGEAIDIGGGYFDVSDQEFLSGLLQMTFDTNMNIGVLKEYNLRFILKEFPFGYCVVFADMTSEQATLQNMIRSFLLLGSVAFLVFLLISNYFAKWAVKPVVSAWQQQKQFVADASHELKTPLTVIMTDAELLHASDCPETDIKPLSANILTMSSQMGGLVENLLDLARIDSGIVKEEFGNVLFSDIVLDTAMMFEPVFYEKGLSLQYEINPNIYVHGNSAHLKQLISIFLDNAVKYSSYKGITKLKLSCVSHKRCLLVITNQGEPISNEDLKNIFKRFYRVDKAREMRHSYGLGLSIAQSIVEEHHGKIHAESSDGYNSFYVEIPCTE